MGSESEYRGEGADMTVVSWGDVLRRLPLVCVGTYLIGQVLGHVFVWTYVAGAEGREKLTQAIILLVVGGALSAAFLVAVDRSNTFRPPVKRGSVIRVLAVYFGAMAVLLWLELWVFEGIPNPLYSLDACGVVLTSTLLLGTVCWFLGLAPRDELKGKAAAVAFGLALTWALLRGPGTSWLLWFLILAAVIPVALRALKRIDFPNEKLVANWLIFILCAIVWQFVFGRMRWDSGLSMIIASVLASSFAIRLSAGGARASRGELEPKKVATSLSRMALPWQDGMLRSRFGVSGGEILVTAWIALVFNLLCWNEPSFQDPPRKPGLLDVEMQEPTLPGTRKIDSLIPGIEYVDERPPISSFVDMSRYSDYSAEMDRYSRFQLERSNQAASYRGMSEFVGAWNDAVAGEVYARRWTKGIALVVLPIVTFLYLSRLASAGATVKAAVAGVTASGDGERASRSAQIG